jgi:predicted RNA binding protein YcfA (HicA-like mRNA interferase family)
VGSNLYRETTALLKAAGCYFVRQGKGDHEIWHSPISNRRFTVPSKLVKTHTANNVLTDAGLPKHF